MSGLSLKTLSQSEIEYLHKKTMDIFENVGFKVTHDETLNRLKKAGTNVSESDGIVKIPQKLFDELLACAPAVAIETGLNGKQMTVGDNHRYFQSLILDPFINDYEQGKRLPILEDVCRHTIIGESLGRINAMMRMQFPVSDIPEPDSYYKTMEVFLCHHTKHVMIYPTSEQNCRDWFDVYEVIADAAGLNVKTTPLVSVAMAVITPLQLHGMNVEIMKMAMERCYPIIPTICPMAGTTSPFSVAGTALLANVESLIPVLIAQLYKPGHPVFYSIAPSVTDFRTGHDLYYKAEKMLWKTIACQMGKFYNLPISGETGGSLTHLPDMQNGAESFAYMLTSIVNGQNILGGVGSMGNANGMSQEQIIMQCGLIDMAEYLARGVDMSDYKLAVDSITQVGTGGNYMTDTLTMDLLRGDEFFTTEHFDLTGGYSDPSLGIYELAHQKALDLVANYKSTVPDKIQNVIRKFFASKYSDKTLAAY
ncbi:MAG: Trimethylamine:corrinoid methyltransferase [Candidatus Uhrbacteria bacterium GW2011_GWF2_41_16]|uniref:Trimethylamine:corrinoid methyltransferase n=1 Tax=Candidatus Uhrbacteria bacterium GW2011_GWF2_41_16 TaxID=1618997 RepID=A0A0G0V4S6_9BACT|nr:MAG: Trimethylamine:corrinoid methyltransferase [Candidatus Uhrbacteria bacterium GW2011_GWF2_41_16]